MQRKILTVLLSITFLLQGHIAHAADPVSILPEGFDQPSPPAAPAPAEISSDQMAIDADTGGDAAIAAAEGEAAGASPEIKMCADSAKNAKLACATLSAVTGLGGTEAALLGTLVSSQLPALIGQMASSGKSAAEQCKIQKDINKIITTITTLKAGACTFTMLSCKSACAKDLATLNANPTANKSAIAEATKKKAECAKYTINIGLMAAQAGYGIINTLKAGQCVDDMTAGTLPTATPFQLTDSNVDCSNPNYAATNMVCICRNTPSDPMCGAFNPGGGAGGGGGSVGGSVATPSLNGVQGEDGVEVGEAPKFSGTGGSNQAGNGGAGGGLPGGSGGGGGLGGGDGDGAAGSGLDKNVIQGTSGGGGGISPLAAGGGGGGGMKAGGGGGGSGGGSGFDFKKYLPKSLFKNRGLAGMTVPSTDGVTGPMGPSLWEKVTNRYQVKKSTLIQDK